MSKAIVTCSMSRQIAKNVMCCSTRRYSGKLCILDVAREQKARPAQNFGEVGFLKTRTVVPPQFLNMIYTIYTCEALCLNLEMKKSCM